MEGNQGTKPFQSASERKLFAAIDLLSGKVDCIEKRLNCLTIQQQVAVSTPQQPKDYILTDADWQRVIDEKFLVVCNYSDGSGPTIGTLNKRLINGFITDAGCTWPICRLLNKLGVMQPYFGQGMPIKGNTKVMIKIRSNLCQIGKAHTFDWDVYDSDGDIISFVILE